MGTYRTQLAAGIAALGMAVSGLFAAQRPAASPSSSADVVPAARRSGLRFVDVTDEAGVGYGHRFDGQIGMAAVASAGVAAGDYDGNGFVDLYLVRGDAGAPVLLRNAGDGTFQAVAAPGLVGIGAEAMGPTFGDFTGDGLLDLVVGALKPAQPRLFVGKPGGRFLEVTHRSAIHSIKNTFSSAMGDWDRDGDLDLALGHWDTDCRDGCGGDHLWENVDGRFEPVGEDRELPGYEEDFTFTPNFADVNNDGWPDLLISADLVTSKVFLNDGAGRFVNVTDRSVITDQYGMGAAIGDYDNDGDLDWFVTSNEGRGVEPDGNRLYRNRGDGTFVDVTRTARVRLGGWGWGACFADFDNDGWLDLFNVNGWFDRTDRSRLFMSRRNGRFREMSHRLGLDDFGSGRGVVCFDYDRDGDLDIFTANNGERARLFRNDGGNASAYLAVRLQDRAPNRSGVGARIYVTAGGMTQMRELRCGSNYLSQDPVEAHFGLGDATRIRKVTVVWPDGARQVVRRVKANQMLTIRRSGS